MQSFLNHYVKHHLNRGPQNHNDFTIIMPSKRSVAALKTEFSKVNQSIWLPKIIDIVSFIEKLSNVEILNQEDTILEFYKVYSKLKTEKKPDTFEVFYSWASVLVNDFNELDRFLVNTDQFFEHHKALKNLNYFGVEKTKMIQSYISFWEELPKYYQAFKTHLLKSKQAYQGLAYRIASKQIHEYLELNQNPIVFLGFNALNAAEEHIVETCLINGNCEIAWDIDQFYLNDKNHPANVFVHKYQKKWSAYKSAFINFETTSFSESKTIEIISSPQHIGQAKSVSAILKNMSQDDIENTAIILNDEKLISPILNSIPKDIKAVNITMGLPLNQTPVSDFFNLLVDHQKRQKQSLNYQTLKTILTHKLVTQNNFKSADDIISHLEQQNILSINFQELIGLQAYNVEMKYLLNCFKSYQNPIEFIHTVLDFLDFTISRRSQTFEQYLLAFQKVFTDLKTDLEKYPDLSIMAISLLFKDKQQSEKLSFKGSKSKGLQIMGMLESRLLDFENVILTSVNEGVLPAGKSENSYITYNLKKQYGLPTHTEKDAIYAYHFFRLLQRAKQCYIIYDNDQSSFNKGEKSRFINYLEIFKAPNHILRDKQFSLSTTLESKNFVEVQKTPEIMAKLKSLCEHGLSPTALTTYILNPILFYKRYILGVKEPEQVDAVINPRDFGSVMHESIETFYKHSDASLSLDILDDFLKQSKNLLSTKFDEIYAKGTHQQGLNRIQFETARAYLRRFISKEKQALETAPVKILDIEKSFETLFNTHNHQVKLKGQIDRIDLFGDTLRIIDFKTGNVKPSDLKFDNFDDLIIDYKYAKAFQILFYAFVYSQENDVNDFKAGIISFKNLNAWFMALEFQKNNIIDKEILDNFQHQLGLLIDEILDPNIAFKEKETIFDS